MSLSSLFIVAAIVCFLLVALSIGANIPLLPIGLACFAAGHLPLGTVGR